MDTPIQSNRTTRCNSLSRAPNSSCGSRCIPIAFDTPTSDSNRVAAESRDPSVTSSVRIQQTLRDCRLKHWMSQILGTLQTEKRLFSHLTITQAKPTCGSSWRDGHARLATHLATCPHCETREKTSSYFRRP